MKETRIRELLEEFGANGYNLLERVILAHDGTVQALLSMIFCRPISVRVVDQIERDDYILRFVELHNEDLVAAWARSRICKRRCRPDVLSLVRERRLGLGQIAEVLGIRTSRRILSHGADETVFWREYEILGDGLYYFIQEYFPRGLYRVGVT